MHPEAQSRGDGTDLWELVKQHFPGETFAASDRLGWAGLQAARYRYQPPNEAFQPPLTHHSFVSFIRTPKEFELQSDGVVRTVPPPTGSILMVPAGHSARWRWSNHSDSLHIFLEPKLVARVAAEEFGLDPARLSVSPLDGLHLPQLRAAMLAINDELTGGAGSRLAAESLANLIAVHLIRSSATVPVRNHGTGTLSGAKLRAVVEYVEEHLDTELTVAEMAAAAHLSAYHFARLFKAAVGVPPHRYVIDRRVERARELLLAGDLPLAEVAARTGFSDQSQLTHHFRRAVGVTPGRFRKSARNA